MNLRKSHDRSRGFDIFLVLVALFGFVSIWFGISRGGAWNLLAVAALFGELLLAWSVWIEPNRLIVTRYREALSAEPSAWLRVVFLSDLHAGTFRKTPWYERIAQEVAALHPDLLILGGDYVQDRAEPVADLAPLAPLTTRYGKFFVLGNHDYLDRPREIRETIASWGYEDLTNRSVSIRLPAGRHGADGRALELRGIDDVWYGNPSRFTRSSYLIPHLLVSHEPDTLMDLKEGDTDLVLIGHTHGGQVRFPLLGALWPIPTKLGRSVDRGRRVVNGIRGLVSNGLGEADGRMRLFDPPEIVVVEIGV